MMEKIVNRVDFPLHLDENANLTYKFSVQHSFRLLKDIEMKIFNHKDSTMSLAETRTLNDIDIDKLQYTMKIRFPDSNEALRMLPEPQEGNVEYKLKIPDPPRRRFDRLVTQMNWRLNEGGGEALYLIGVGDDGSAVGLNRRDMNDSMAVLRRMADELSATTKTIQSLRLGDGRFIRKVLISRPQDTTSSVPIFPCRAAIV